MRSGSAASESLAPSPGGPLSDEARLAADDLWHAQHAHPFIRGLADGTLSAQRFGFFIRQDYLYLVDYGRALALAAARAPRLELMTRFSELADATLRTEMELHRQYAARWGISREALEAGRPQPTTRAYANFLLRTATLGEFGELIAAILPCMWGYSELGQRLAEGPRPAHPLYAEWIDTYASDEFAELADWCRQAFDEIAAVSGDATRAAMVEAFVVCSEYELAFWEAAWQAGD